MSITPTLMMGDIPKIQDAYPVETAGQAVLLIVDGLVAVLPADSWAMAEEVLRVTRRRRQPDGALIFYDQGP